MLIIFVEFGQPVATRMLTNIGEVFFFFARKVVSFFLLVLMVLSMHPSAMQSQRDLGIVFVYAWFLIISV